MKNLSITMPVGREEEIQSRRGWQGTEYNYARPKLLLPWVITKLRLSCVFKFESKPKVWIKKRTGKGKWEY
jgi:hypothetical protein